MKFLLLFATLNSVVFAESSLEISEAQRSQIIQESNKFFATRSILETYKNSYTPSKDKDFNFALEKISKDLKQKFKNAGNSMVSTGECTSKCMTYLPNLSGRMALPVDGPSKNAIECQNVCRTYFSEYFTYFDGQHDAQVRMNNSVDCNGVVNNSPRSTAKPVSAIVKEIAPVLNNQQK